MKIETGITVASIAPCGMNCGLCYAHFREKNQCSGCLSKELNKPPHCFNCSIKLCSERNKDAKYCFDCRKYPCTRLNQLDKRYRTKYGMSMIENLENIKRIGIRKFVANEKLRWICSNCKSLICVHRDECLSCGIQRVKEIY